MQRCWPMSARHTWHAPTRTPGRLIPHGDGGRIYLEVDECELEVLCFRKGLNEGRVTVEKLGPQSGRRRLALSQHPEEFLVGGV